MALFNRNALKTLLLEDEAVATKRQSLPHLKKMRPKDFIAFARAILKHKKIKVNLKVDGAAIRFGKDASGKFIFETARSGIITEPGAFSKYNAEHGKPENAHFAIQFDKMFDTIKASGIWKHLPNDTKIVGEIFWNPLAVAEDEHNITFVSVSYPKNKLGKICTLIPRMAVKASTGEALEDSVFKELEKHSTADIKIFHNNLGHFELAFEAVQAVFAPLEDIDPADLEATLASRKKIDKERKDFYIGVIDRIKDDIQSLISKNPKILAAAEKLLGSNIEGLAVTAGDYECKITTDYYKQTSGHMG